MGEWPSRAINFRRAQVDGFVQRFFSFLFFKHGNTTVTWHLFKFWTHGIYLVFFMVNCPTLPPCYAFTQLQHFSQFSIQPLFRFLGGNVLIRDRPSKFPVARWNQLQRLTFLKKSRGSYRVSKGELQNLHYLSWIQNQGFWLWLGLKHLKQSGLVGYLSVYHLWCGGLCQVYFGTFNLVWHTYLRISASR